MTLPFDPLVLVLASPAVAAALLAIIPSYRVGAWLNVLASFVTLAAAGSLFLIEQHAESFFLVDDLNIVFIVLNAFVGFTTSVFSASYIAHELESGRLTPGNLRFYHALFQVMMFGMNLALIAALPGTHRARRDRPCRTARGCGTERCR